jgi:uncharacterized protein (DUF2126 family)
MSFCPMRPSLRTISTWSAAVEDTCLYLKMPVWVEGYAPPFRSAAAVLQRHARPRRAGNQPAAREQLGRAGEQSTRCCSRRRARNRLTAEKFNYDGGHIATGGGSHIVIGGATVLDSPLLRRPDLLRSMVAFWQNHPSLSYLFSGMYVGPTSQYPRVDEARMDALYELEVAFRNLPAAIARRTLSMGCFAICWSM